MTFETVDCFVIVFAILSSSQSKIIIQQLLLHNIEH